MSEKRHDQKTYILLSFVLVHGWLASLVILAIAAIQAVATGQRLTEDTVWCRVVLGAACLFLFDCLMWLKRDMELQSGEKKPGDRWF